jgi:hypothetical protein
MNVLGVTPAVDSYTEEVRLWQRKNQRPASPEESYPVWTIDGVALPHCVPFDRAAAYSRNPVLDFVTPLTRVDTMNFMVDMAAPYLDRISGRAGPDSNNGRTGLLVCRCGFWGCGSLSAFVVRNADVVEWRDAAWYEFFEDDYVPAGPPPTGPRFVFDAQQYDQVLADLTAEFAPPKAL